MLRALAINTFAGEDNVKIEKSSFNGPGTFVSTKINLGDDDDKLKINDSTFAEFDADGGLGDDQLDEDGNTYILPPIFESF